MLLPSGELPAAAVRTVVRSPGAGWALVLRAYLTLSRGLLAGPNLTSPPPLLTPSPSPAPAAPPVQWDQRDDRHYDDGGRHDYDGGRHSDGGAM